MNSLTPDHNYNTEVHYNDGTTVKIYATQLSNKGLSDFFGWECEAGVTRICILPDSAVYSGECENDFLGRLSDNTFKLLDNPTTCKKTRCIGNPDDLMTKKSAQPDNKS
jgi:hypothetical protein